MDFNSQTVFMSSARIFTPTQRSANGLILSEGELLARAKSRAFNPASLDTNAPIFFPVQMSSNVIDLYFTRMNPKTLANFAADAEGGVSFQDSHRTNALGLGATLSGRFVQDSAETVRAVADVFTVGGIAEIDAFIHRLNVGIARDASVGFYGGDFICGLCGMDLFDWDCPHIPGVEYDQTETDAAGNVIQTTQMQAFAWVDDAHLAELSVVYKGATPGAGILKAQQENAGGRVTPAIYQQFQTAHRGLAIPGYRALKSVSGTGGANWPYADDDSEDSPPASTTRAPAHNKGDSNMGTETKPVAGSVAIEDREPTPDPIRKRIMDTCKELKIAGETPEEAIRTMYQLAQDGQTYRDDLTEQALTEGVRAFGKDFDKESYRTMFANVAPGSIKRMLGDWKRVGDGVIPTGRQTEEMTGATGKEDKDGDGNRATDEIEDDADFGDDAYRSIAPASAFGR